MEAIVELARSVWGLWLMLVFLGIVAWTMWPSRKKKLEDQAKIPFRDS
jgi:cytochrome c oxidase cbb3-type subunit 4